MPDLRTRPLDLVYGTAILSAEALAAEVRDRLNRDISRRFNNPRYPYWAAIQQAADILAELEPLLAKNFAITDLASYILGFDTVAKNLPEWAIPQVGNRPLFPPPADPPRLTFDFGDGGESLKFPMIEKAAESLEKRGILTRAEFDQLGADARARAFTVAGDVTQDTIKTVRDVLRETVSEGASLDEFKARLGESIEKSFLGPGHLETVYRTNVQAAFSDGGEALASNPVVRELFPFREYLPIHDGRVDPEHLALGSLGLDGTGVYWADDPMWDLFMPPWRFNCRCGTNLLTIGKAASKGVRAAQEWLRTGVEPQHESRLPAIPFRPAAGWGGRRRAAQLVV